MPKLFLGGQPVSARSAKILLTDAGLGQELASSDLNVDKTGKVTVASNSKDIFSAPLITTQDLKKLNTALGKAFPNYAGQATATDRAHNLASILRVTRDVHAEQRMNDRVLGNATFGTKLNGKFMGGQKFELGLWPVSKRRAEIISAPTTKFPELKKIKAFFQKDGKILMPIHPAEVRCKTIETPKSTPIKVEAACASSERTLHLYEPDLPNFLLKTPLPSIVHFHFQRPIYKDDALSAVDKTKYLMSWADKTNSPRDAFCFLPEPMAIVDKRSDQASIIRLATPYPAPKQDVWLLPTYSLYADDIDKPGVEPVLVSMIKSQKKKKPLSYFTRDIVGPIIKSAMRVYLDLGASNASHGQNMFLEIGEDGHPTGRAAHADIEGIWPNPTIGDAAKVDSFYKKYGYEHGNEGKVWKQTEKEKKGKLDDRNLEDTFRTYFLNGLLLPILRTFEKYFPKDADEARWAVYNLLKSEVKKRRKVVEQFKGPGELYEELALFLTDQFAFDEYVKDEKKAYQGLKKELRDYGHPTAQYTRLS